MDELVARLAARASETPKGEWVRGRGYDDTLIREKRHPTRADLDRASTEHPIYIGHISGHLGVANSVALEMAGITKETPEPSGGVIRKDPETGEPNGVFEESMSLVTRLIPPLDENDRLAAIRWAVADYVEEGVTTTVIAHGSTNTLRDLQRARGDGLLSLRVISMGSKGSLDALSPGEAGGFVTGFGDTRLKLGAVKVIQDGSIQGFTGYLVEPYYAPFKGDASYRGYPRRERDELVAMEQRTGFSYSRAGVGLQISKRLSDTQNLFFRYRFDNTETFDLPEGMGIEDLDRRFQPVRIGAVSVASVTDQRDDPLNPAAGQFRIMDVEWSTKVLATEAPYLKGLVRQFFYRSLPHDMVLAVGMRLGVAYGWSRLPDELNEFSIPIVERFFAGGATTLRGFALDRASPLRNVIAVQDGEPIIEDGKPLIVKGEPAGGNVISLLNLELRFPIWGNLRGVAFSDNGGAYPELSDFTIGDWRYNVGFGFRYETPLGPLRVDYGLKLDRRTFKSIHCPDQRIACTEPLGRWHVSLGHAF